MSDIFEQDIYDDTEDLSSLEDGYTSDDRGSENFVFPKDLYRLKLDYSCEGVYATAPEGLSVKAGERVIVPTRYGSDLAVNLGRANCPVGIKPSDVVQIVRVADQHDLEHAAATTV